MKYEKSAAYAGYSSVAWAVGMFFALCAIQIFYLGIDDVIPIMWILGLMPVALCGYLGVALIRDGGKWEITIDRDGVNWLSPAAKVAGVGFDDSFQFTLEELDRVETRISTGPEHDKYFKYFLVTRSGEEQQLRNTSGIKLRDVIVELERLGVRHETVDFKKLKKLEKRKKAAEQKVNQQETVYGGMEKEPFYHA